MSHPVLFLAAGFGRRMQPLTLSKPKPLIEVGSTTLLDHAIALAEEVNLGPLVANAHYLADQITAHLAGRPIQISHETPEILDSGGALKAALPLLKGDPVFTLNTDNIWSGPNPFKALLSAWDPQAMDVLMLLGPPERVHGRDGPGDFTLKENGRLSRGGDMVYLGLQLLRTDPFAHHPSDVFGMWDVWTQALNSERLFGVTYDGDWCDVGRPESLPLAEDMLGYRDV